MTETTMTMRPHRGFARSMWLWLPDWRLRRTSAADLDTLSDHMLRDIGIRRDEIDRMQRNTLRAAMRLRN